MPTIVVLNGKNVGQWFTIGEMPLVFGRDKQLLAEISDPCVSQQHMQAAINPSDGSVYVEEVPAGGPRFVVLLPGADVASVTKQEAAV